VVDAGSTIERERATPTGGPFALFRRSAGGDRTRVRHGRGGESDTKQRLRAVSCLRAGERLRARARPARPIPASSTCG